MIQVKFIPTSSQNNFIKVKQGQFGFQVEQEFW